MIAEEAALYNDSLERCTAQPRFLHRFYDIFCRSSPEVAEKFVNTDFSILTEKLHTSLFAMLKSSLYVMLLPTWSEAPKSPHLERLAWFHGREGRDIPPELYDLWLESLIQAVREFDPHFDERTEWAWRSMMKPGIEFMKSRY